MAKRDDDHKNLHPVLRKKVNALLKALDNENIPFKLFEGYRSPERQAYLYAKGRTTPGPRVSNAGPWQSYHQYGVAGDFVLYLDGRWSWDITGERKHWWDRLHELGRDVGLKALSWEMPHLQLAEITLADLRAGRYPENGDSDWAENLEDAITSWAEPASAPPVPDIILDRPPLEVAGGDVDETTAPSVSGNKRYRINARNGLRLREGPGTEFDIIAKLTNGQIVTHLSTAGDWFKVDLENDGIADGFCYRAYLEIID